MISNAHLPQMVEVTNQNGKWMIKPNLVRDYNESMSGVDRSNQMLSYHSALRKTIRWYKKVGVHMLKILITNDHFFFRNTTAIQC